MSILSCAGIYTHLYEVLFARFSSLSPKISVKKTSVLTTISGIKLSNEYTVLEVPAKPTISSQIDFKQSRDLVMLTLHTK